MFSPDRNSIEFCVPAPASRVYCTSTVPPTASERCWSTASERTDVISVRRAAGRASNLFRIRTLYSPF